MSLRLFRSDVLFYQRLLKASGFYTGSLDGKWGPMTRGADEQFFKEFLKIQSQVGEFDFRTEYHIFSLVPAVQQLAREFMNLALASGGDIKIISGIRTYEEQKALFRKGRWGNPGPKVTNAQAGQSYHNFGLAWDIAIFDDSGTYITESEPYENIATSVVSVLPDLEWGGNWISFKDLPHYQHRASDISIKEVRRKFEKGEPYF